MDQTPLISFIIPVYNLPAEMVSECINSIRTLTLSTAEREIIVVDDGSDTAYADSLSAVIDDVIYIRQKNSGVSVARNTGLRMAAGRFMQFIDGDDLLTTAYEHIIDLLRFEKSDMVMFDFTRGGDEVDDYSDDGPSTGAELLRKNNIHGSVCGFVFSANILGTLRFTPGIAYGEDEEFTPQLLLRAERVFTSSAKAYFYRQRPTSAVGSSSIRKKMRRLDDTKRVILHLHQLEDSLPQTDRLAIRRRSAQLTMDYIYNIIILTRSRQYLERKLSELQAEGLFPLPDVPYTKKYKWFRRMTSTKLGRAILMQTIPLMKKEP